MEKAFRVAGPFGGDIPKWLEWRRGRMGASDSAAILGTSEHYSRRDIYLDKIGALNHKDSEEKEAGNLLEPVICELYTRRTGVPIRKRQVCVESTVFPWMGCSIDAVNANKRAVELKALSVFSANEFRARDREWWALPYKFLVQCHHIMICLEHDVMDLAVFKPLKCLVYEIPRDEELCRIIVDKTAELWDCVVDRIPPPPFTEKDAEKIADAYPKIHGTQTIIDPGAIDAAYTYFHTESKGAAGKAKAAAKVAMIEALREAEFSVLPNGDIIERRKTVRKGHTVEDKEVVTYRLIPKGEVQ